MLRPTLHRCWLASLLTVACALEDASATEDEATDDEATDDEADVDDEPPRPDGELVGLDDPAENTCPPVNGNTCHPLYQYECPAGQGCYFDGLVFSCAPDLSGPGGFDGDPCGAQAECNPGHTCINSWYLPGCANPSACCTPFEPLGGHCNAQPEPLPFYPQYGYAPAPSECYARIGICAIDPIPPR